MRGHATLEEGEAAVWTWDDAVWGQRERVKVRGELSGRVAVAEMPC